MIKDRYQYSRIEDYILGVLTPEERERFEKDLTKDVLLLEQYNIHLAEHEVMEQIVADGLRQKFSQWRENPPRDPEKYPLEPDKTRNAKWIFYLIATISFGFLAVATCHFVDRTRSENQVPKDEPMMENIDTLSVKEVPPNYDSTQTHQEGNDKSEQNNLRTNGIDPNSGKSEADSPSEKDNINQYDMAYVEIANDFYSTPEEFLSSLRSDRIGKESKLNDAIVLFQEGKYQEALNLLNGQGLPNNNNEQYLRGHILFNLNRFKEAIVMFNKLAHDAMLPHYDDARWNLFLAYTATLPSSKKDWELLKNILQSDAGFGYKREFNSLIAKMDMKK